MRYMIKDNFIGVIYSLPENLANRIFEEHKDVFIKFLPSRVKKINLEEGSKILISISKANKKVLGEATINKIEFLNKEDLLNKYKNNIFLNKEDLDSYCFRREDRKLLVLTLIKINRYKQEKFSKDYINMGGKYLSKKDYLYIIGESK